MPELPVRLFAVPRRGRTILCAVEGGRLADLGPLPMPPLAEHAISDTGWIAWLEDDGRTIRRAHCDAEPAEQKFPSIRLPDGYAGGHPGLPRAGALRRRRLRRGSAGPVRLPRPRADLGVAVRAGGIPPARQARR